MARQPLEDDTLELFRAMVKAFVAREVVPRYAKWERAGIIDKDLFEQAGAAGIIGTAVPEELGGGGADDYRCNAILAEEFCRADALNAYLGFSVHVDIVIPYFLALATDDQRRRWLPGLASGHLVGAIAMTEPGTGSDLAAISTKATRDGDAFVLTGSKTFITNGQNCDLVVVVCRTGDAQQRHANLSLLVVEDGMPGFHKGRNLEKVGQHAADTSELFFDGVRIPVANLLGEEHQAFRHLMQHLPQERLSIAVTALAHAEAAFERTLAYCRERYAFGQPIAAFQNSRFVLATLRTELDVGRAFVDQQIASHMSGALTPEEAAEAKWWVSDLNRRVLDACLQLHGGYGYMEEYSIARAWRDGRAMSIYGGTNEIMKELIGRRLLGI